MRPDPSVLRFDLLEKSLLPMAERLSAAERRWEESRAAAVPSAQALQKIYSDLEGMKRGLDELRALTGPLTASARNQEIFRLELDRTTGKMKEFLSTIAAAAPGPSPMEDARAAQRAFIAGSLDDAIQRVAAAKSMERERQEKRRARMVRLLDRWRQAWRERLERHDSSLREEMARTDAAKAAASDRLNQERARLAEHRAALEGGRILVEEDRRRLAESVRKAEDELRRREEEIRGWEEKTRTIAGEISSLENRRREEAQAAATDLERLKREAKEERKSWRERMNSLEASAAGARTEGERTLSVVLEEGARDLNGLRSGISEEEARLAREKSDLESEARAFAERSTRESREALERVELRRTEAESLEAKRRELEEALQKEKNDFAAEVDTLRSWSEARARTLRLLLTKSENESQAALAAVKAERARRETELSAEKERLRAEIEALRRKGEMERVSRAGILEEARLRHEGRLESLRLEERELESRSAALSRETELLKTEIESLAEKSKARLLRRRAAHDKIYAETKQRGESKATIVAMEEMKERAAVEALERRLQLRRRRFDGLRERRRREAEELVHRAQVSLDEALEAQCRTESQVMERVRSAEGQARDWAAFRDRLKKVPVQISEGEAAAGARDKGEFSSELSRLSSEGERRWEELKASTARHRGVLSDIQNRLGSADEGLAREETDFQQFLSAVQAQTVYLDGLRRFFKTLRPSVEILVRSEVVPK